MAVMKQKDAVKILLEFLPQESILHRYNEPKSILDVWCTTNDSYCHNDDNKHFHFSPIPCTRPGFAKTMCLCFTVASNGHITYFDRHLPCKGTGPGCKK